MSNDDDIREHLALIAQQFISSQKQLAIDEALAGDWGRYDWLAGRINRILWGEQEAA